MEASECTILPTKRITGWAQDWVLKASLWLVLRNISTVHQEAASIYPNWWASIVACQSTPKLKLVNLCFQRTSSSTAMSWVMLNSVAGIFCTFTMFPNWNLDWTITVICLALFQYACWLTDLFILCVFQTGTYIVCTKSTGFNLDATCNDGSMVIMGIRVLLGSQDINRVPSYIQVCSFPGIT